MNWLPVSGCYGFPGFIDIFSHVLTTNQLVKNITDRLNDNNNKIVVGDD